MAFFQWAQLKHVIPTRWKKITIKYIDINGNNM